MDAKFSIFCCLFIEEIILSSYRPKNNKYQVECTIYIPHPLIKMYYVNTYAN